MATTILQLSDIHLQEEVGAPLYGVDPDQRLQTVLAAWRARVEHADLVLLSGDLSEDGSPASYERLARTVSDLGAPVLAIPGNHDDPVALAERFDAPRIRSIGGWHVVGIDSALPGEVHGAVDVSQLDAVLTGLTGPVLVAVHHPPRSRSTHEWFQLHPNDEVLACLRRHPDVRGVVSGHTHEPFERAIGDRCQLLGCPSTVVGMAHDGDAFTVGDAPTGARILFLGDDGDLTSTVLVA